jgi:hypothetical protein
MSIRSALVLPDRETVRTGTIRFPLTADGKRAAREALNHERTRGLRGDACLGEGLEAGGTAPATAANVNEIRRSLDQ